MIRILSGFILVILNLCFFLECKTSTESISITNRDIIYNKYYDLQTEDTNLDVCPEGMINVSSGGLLVCGRMSKSSIPQESFILRVDDKGNEIWHSSFGGHRLLSSIETLDGSFIAVGGYPQGTYLVKCDSDGNLIWEKYVQILNGGAAHKVILTKANNLIVLTNTHSASKALILKVDLSGEIIWQKSPTPNEDGGRYYAITEDSQGNFVVIGVTNKYIFGDDPDIEQTFWIEKIDSNGEKIEHKIYNEDLYTLQQNSIVPIDEHLFIGSGLSYITYLDVSGNVTKYTIPYPEHRYSFFTAYDIDINQSGNIFVIGSLNKGEGYTTDDKDFAYFQLSSTCESMFSSVENENRYVESVMLLVNYNDDESIITSGFRKFSDNQGSKVWVSKFYTN